MKLIEKGKPSFRGILVIHGFMGQARDWDFLVKNLSRRHYLVLIDLNEDKTTIPTWPDDLEKGMALAKKNIEKLLESIKNFSKSRGVKEWCILGYSLGGRLAALLADSLFVHVLIMESAGFGFRKKKEREKRFVQDKKLYLEIKKNWGEAFLRNWYRESLFREIMKEKDKFERLIKKRLELKKGQVLRQLILYGQAFLPSVDSNKIPVKKIYLLSGEWDMKYSSLNRNESNFSQNIKTLVKTKASHNIHFCYPDWFCRWVSNIWS